MGGDPVAMDHLANILEVAANEGDWSAARVLRDQIAREQQRRQRDARDYAHTRRLEETLAATVRAVVFEAQVQVRAREQPHAIMRT